MNAEKTNTLGSANQSVPSRRPLEEALDELAGAINRVDALLEQLSARLDPISIPAKTCGTDGGGSPLKEHSAVVHYINSQIIRVEQLAEHVGNIYARLEV